jgi:hypothetical protein
MSAYTLTNLIQAAVIKMGTLATYRPTPVPTSGGSASVITDTALALNANELVKGLVIVTRDAGGANAAPEGQFSAIASNTATAITVSPAFTATVEVGDEIMVIRPKYALADWRRTANIALKSLGDIPLWDISLTMVAGQTEYTLPAVIIEPIDVYAQTSKTTGDYEWVKLDNWTTTNAAPGTAKTLIINSDDINPTYLLGIVYNGVHPTVYAYNDPIEVPLELAASVLAWYMINRGGIVTKNQSQADKILSELNDAKRNFTMPRLKTKPTKFLSWGR